MSFRSSITHLAEARGSREERQVVARWRAEIDSFLEAFAGDIQRDNNRLEIGLETGLVLKLVVKRYRTPPVGGLARLAESFSGLAGACVREVLRAGYDFHVGLRVQADRCHRELYVYDRNREFSAFLGRHIALPPCPEGASTITAFGIDELDGISAYLTVRKNPRVGALLPALGEKLSSELRTPVAAHLSDAWEHLRLRDGRWVSGKFGVELHDIPLPLATRIISHYRPPHFGYLAPFAEYASIVIAGSPDGKSQAWYFTRSRSDTSYAETGAPESASERPARPAHEDMAWFYGKDSIADWQAILGTEMPYTFGHFVEKDDDLKTAQARTVSLFYKDIAPGSRVLDLGCGWGHPAHLLQRDLGCRMTCVSNTPEQLAYIRDTYGIDTLLHDMEQGFTHPGEWDIAIFMESLEHVQNKRQILADLHARVPRLIVRLNATRLLGQEKGLAFGQTMAMVTEQTFTELLRQTGWKIEYIYDTRRETLPNLVHWKRNIERHYGQNIPEGNPSVLYGFCCHGLENPEAWIHNNPVLNILATRA